MTAAKTYSVNYDDSTYFVTVDRRRLGDSRSYTTYEEAKAAADAAADAQGEHNGVRYAISIPGYRRP
jgi:hypothetical protein